MSGMPRVVFSLHDLLTRWEASAFPLLVVLLLIAAGAWYLRADWTLAARGRRWKTRRTISFFAGLVTIDLALQSPIATMTGTYFQAHVVQHLLLMAVAPPLLAMGAPSTLYLQTTSRKHKERWLAVLRSGPFEVLTNPVLVAFLYYGVMFIFFLTSLINVAMTHMWLMDVINVFFLFGGTLFWWPMVGIDPIIHWKLGFGARMFFVLIGSAIDAFLGVAILNLSHPVASMYTLSSSHAGGGLISAGTDVLALVALRTHLLPVDALRRARRQTPRPAPGQSGVCHREFQRELKWQLQRKPPPAGGPGRTAGQREGVGMGGRLEATGRELAHLPTQGGRSFGSRRRVAPTFEHDQRERPRDSLVAGGKLGELTGSSPARRRPGARTARGRLELVLRRQFPQRPGRVEGRDVIDTCVGDDLERVVGIDGVRVNAKTFFAESPELQSGRARQPERAGSRNHRAPAVSLSSSWYR